MNSAANRPSKYTPSTVLLPGHFSGHSKSHILSLTGEWTGQS